ncbi:MAG: hypothetical protein ABSG23_12405 [Terriglobales bacterium]|jgi:hypothetical protein
MPEQLDSAKVEEFVRWFLRLNGYFGIESFIVHAADDPTRISNGMIAPHTETDTIAVRMPYSKEIAGSLKIANYPRLIANSDQRFDVVIAEAKGGDDTRPNPVWRDCRVDYPVKYIVRFIGLYESEAEVTAVAKSLLTKYCYEDEKCRFRYIVFSKEANPHYASRGVTYLDLRDIVNFLVEVRGQCWIEENIGVASIHHQWNPLVREIFAVANNQSVPGPQRSERAYKRFLELAAKAA